MDDWMIGAVINLVGSIGINFGTNLLKLGHDQRERLQLLSGDGDNKIVVKPIIYFNSWRVGILFFALGNCLNFISFGYAAQSLLAALGSIQFVSNIAFSYFVLSRNISFKIIVATAFIVFGNIFLVSFGNHQSPVYSPEQLGEKYNNIIFLLYCVILVLVVAISHYIYRRGEGAISSFGSELSAYWMMLLPFSYATISGAIGSCSVLFAKSLSNLLRLSISGNYKLHGWFTYSMLLLFLSTAGFWMTRLNEGLALFDAILIVPMFQISWTFFSISTGFIYFQEYQVFDSVRISMFLLGMAFVFIGISLLAPDASKNEPSRDSSLSSSIAQGFSADVTRLTEGNESHTKVSINSLVKNATSLLAKAKDACSLSLGLGEESLNASSVLVMPMVSSRATGLRGNILNRSRHVSLRSSRWNSIANEGDALNTPDAIAWLHQTLD